MVIPFSHQPTEEQRYKYRYISSLKKAKHLSQRVKTFVSDLEKSGLKEKDRKEIIKEVMSFLNT